MLLRGLISISVYFVAVLCATTVLARATCGDDMDQDAQEFHKNLKAFHKENRELPRSKRGLAQKKWLENVHKDIVAHEQAHARAQGKWHDKIVYYYYSYRNKKYAYAGCAYWKGTMPLNRMLESALAPKNPSKSDYRKAKQVQSLIKIKSIRARCKTSISVFKRRSCLDNYKKFSWLDDYPM